ncbi:uncharacterized protein LAESUDRAFT_730877 [Laetiporus sulphureus 93-53]|uniref:Uncharacterized protein n=1 Tax=Laetiporus sulphureus 93-53 TaxID=1314785 RepID=A0A165BWU6_9APHY|nr:uncharacterized protein LAESUDRAFT_730877 [Laetiporus sulphureus 93-53]KZT01796.1 hypothetical protein LAESUDRAFT_730877 [Laetiporus sulphureus 93-53]
MKPAYVSLPSSSQDDSEDKPLVGSPDVEEYLSAHSTSPRLAILIYVLCAMTILVAVINFIVLVDLRRFKLEGVLSIGDLPRPDIFAGLPDLRSTAGS